jgi:hypothetical protein
MGKSKTEFFEREKYPYSSQCILPIPPPRVHNLGDMEKKRERDRTKEHIK